MILLQGSPIGLKGQHHIAQTSLTQSLPLAAWSYRVFCSLCPQDKK